MQAGFPSPIHAVSSTHGLTPGAVDPNAATPETVVSTGRLANGMDVVVIPDHRAPVVTHMVWYRNGSGR